MVETTEIDSADVDTPTIDKPLLRGWFHVGAAPVALFAGMTLMVFGPTLAGRVSSARIGLPARPASVRRSVKPMVTSSGFCGGYQRLLE